MASTSLLALLDDIASVLDDVAAMTKLAAQKTAGVLGDDLALNAQQVAGVRAERELPVVWAVAKGSLKNKAFLVPAALLINGVLPWAVTPLLMLGGLFLCYEGVEKLAHRFLHPHEKKGTKASGLEAASEAASETDETPVDLAALEKEKIRGAVRTDFILSSEIIVITLGTVAQVTFWIQVAVLVGIAIIMTAGVYGLVAGIVKLDDVGFYLSRRREKGFLASALRGTGRGLLAAAPWLMKALSVIGTLAMFLVGGGILLHGIPPLQAWVASLHGWLAAIPGVGGLLAALTGPLADALLGIVAGALALALVTAGMKIVRKVTVSKDEKQA
jgi:predicted DNA repair protein MutK